MFTYVSQIKNPTFLQVGCLANGIIYSTEIKDQQSTCWYSSIDVQAEWPSSAKMLLGLEHSYLSTTYPLTYLCIVVRYEKRYMT